MLARTVVAWGANCALALCLPKAASAQTALLKAYSVHPQLGFNVAYVGVLEGDTEFGKSGLGGAISYRQPLDKVGLTAFRVDAAYSYLGSSRSTVLESIAPRVQSLTQVGISHSAFLLDAGFQLQAPTGILRPYVAASGGLARISSSLTVARNVNFSEQRPDSSGTADNVLMYSGTAGVLLMTSSRDAPVFLDVGVKAFRTSSFQALLASRATTDSQGRLSTPETNFASASRFMVFIGLTLTLH